MDLNRVLLFISSALFCGLNGENIVKYFLLCKLAIKNKLKAVFSFNKIFISILLVIIYIILLDTIQYLSQTFKFYAYPERNIQIIFFLSLLTILTLASKIFFEQSILNNHLIYFLQFIPVHKYAGIILISTLDIFKLRNIIFILYFNILGCKWLIFPSWLDWLSKNILILSYILFLNSVIDSFRGILTLIAKFIFNVNLVKKLFLYLILLFLLIQFLFDYLEPIKNFDLLKNFPIGFLIDALQENNHLITNFINILVFLMLNIISISIFLILISFYSSKDFAANSNSNLFSFSTLLNSKITSFVLLWKELLLIYRNILFYELFIFILVIIYISIFLFLHNPMSLIINLYLFSMGGILWSLSIIYIWNGEQKGIRQYFLLPVKIKNILLSKDVATIISGLFVQFFVSSIFIILPNIYYNLKYFLINLFVSFLYIIGFLTIKNLFLEKFGEIVYLNSLFKNFHPPENKLYTIISVLYFYSFFMFMYFVLRMKAVNIILTYIIILIFIAIVYNLNTNFQAKRMVKEREYFIYSINGI